MNEITTQLEINQRCSLNVNKQQSEEFIAGVLDRLKEKMLAALHKKKLPKYIDLKLTLKESRTE